jgi:hypothetical protein
MIELANLLDLVLHRWATAQLDFIRMRSTDISD